MILCRSDSFKSDVEKIGFSEEELKGYGEVKNGNAVHLTK